MRIICDAHLRIIIGCWALVVVLTLLFLLAFDVRNWNRIEETTLALYPINTEELF